MFLLRENFVIEEAAQAIAAVSILRTKKPRKNASRDREKQCRKSNQTESGDRMPKYNVIEAIESFIASGEPLMKIDVSKYSSKESAHFSYYSCVRKKRIKGCRVCMRQGEIYLIRE
jgi:hypothetical protein